MDQGKIIKYTASAGSGKTHTLTGEYLLRLFASPTAYRRILAVTFTNKAAAEMKSRILEELAHIASGGQTRMLDEITGKLSMSPARAQSLAALLLSNILGDYSRFSVGTIDSFFQRVFRAFTREIGIQANYSIYIDHSIILRDTVDELINNLNESEDLRKWIVRYAGSLFDDGKPIDLSRSIYKLAGTIFSEQFKLLPDHIKEKLSDLRKIEKFVSEMEGIIASFRNNLRQYGMEAIDILDRNGVDEKMLRGGSKGVGRYLRLISGGLFKEPYNQLYKALDEDSWYSASKITGPVDAALADGLRDRVSAIVAMFRNDYSNYQTAEVVLRNIYMAAILTDVVRVLRSRTSNENSFVLADTGDLLMQVIGNDQTPFIYEKSGNEYDVFMIDEFQDTSMIQYRNFKPLIENSLAQGSDTLIVGDIKQSIYRWRNGDWSILGRWLEHDFTKERVDSKVLLTNWRSQPEIVRFNNTLFTVLPGLLNHELYEQSALRNDVTDITDSALLSKCDDATATPFSFTDVYRDVVQSVPGSKQGGYIRIMFHSSDDDGKAKDKSLADLPEIIMGCQDDGYKAGDIGILVRNGSEGSEVLDYLTSYRSTLSPENQESYNFNVLSGDSLIVGNSPAVRFIVCTMIHIADRDNPLNRAEMLRYYLLVKPEQSSGEPGFAVASMGTTEEAIYPEGFNDFLNLAGSKPLFGLSEEIISFFSLNLGEADMACLCFFQDQVLEYMNRRGSGLKAFTEWWNDEGSGKSVVLSGEQDALRIMTIHKAKGLQFKIVILPFLSWDFNPKSGHLLWVQPEEEPFDTPGAFPVGYSASLDSTLFSTEYQQEKAFSHLDNLNLLYVAFTRAEERLYGFAFSRKKGETGMILKSALMTETEETNQTMNLLLRFNEEKGIFETGSTAKNRAVESQDTLIPAEYPVYEGGNRLKLRLYGRDLLKESEGGLKSKIYYGTVLHEILSRIRYRSDLKEAIDSVVTEGYIPVGIAEKTRELVEEMISRKSVSRWFDDDKEVLTEPEILTGTGDIRRPDRVVRHNGRVMVIDYKFGEERREHIVQIKGYRDLLADMGYDVEEASLWYVETDKIVSL